MPSSNPPQPRYPDLATWVERWFALSINRRFWGKPGHPGKRWCPRWWDHPEVVLRLNALWRSWEAAAAGGATDANTMNAWWINCCEPHLRVILDGEHGPMALCGQEQHIDPGGLTVEPVPAGWWTHSRTSSPNRADRHGDGGGSSGSVPTLRT